MTLTRAARRAARVPAVARDGWRYPLRRLQAQSPVDARGALQGLGFPAGLIATLADEFESVAAKLYPRLAEVARAQGDREAERRVSAPSASSRDGKLLLYVATRLLEPLVVVETGAFNGASSAFLLEALARNGRGRLVSFDLEDARDALGVPLPAGCRAGWLVPPELRSRFELVLGDARRTLPVELPRLGSVDLFVHDSLHTFRHMSFEYRLAWRHLRPGGLLVSDDVFWNPAFWLFTTLHRTPFCHTGTVGLTRKPQ
jgi:predicted O-methyltransferase YrrM